ncbi:MAG: helix-turn-helix domain-containing protein [Frankiaceae bacterium]
MSGTGKGVLADVASLRVRELGDYIREQRKAAQISLRQLARQAGVSNPYLSQIERGLRKPSAEILQQIARALRISAEALYVQAGILEERPGDRSAQDAITRDGAISERQKQVLLEIYDSFRRENEIRAPEGPLPADADLGATETGSGDGGVEAGLIDTVQAETVLGETDLAAAELADEALAGPPAGPAEGAAAAKRSAGSKPSAGAKPSADRARSRRAAQAGPSKPDETTTRDSAPSAAEAG